MRYTFVCEKHKEYGFTGWRLKNQSDFDPLPGMGVAHDCLEHFSSCELPHCEFMALGASMWIRDQAYRAYDGHMRPNPGYHIASDLPDIMRHIQHEGMGLRDAPKTRASVPELEREIDLMFRNILRNAEEFDQETYPDDATRSNIRSWLRIGYRKAVKRYGGNQWRAGDMFRHIERKADMYLKQAEVGAELVVRVSISQMSADVKLNEYPGEDW